MAKALIPMLLIILVAPGLSAKDPAFGVGVAGGAIIPIVQDDEGTGSHFTLRGMFYPVNVIGLEANFTIARFGNPKIDLPGVTSNLEGSNLTAYGIDAIIGGGPGGSIRPFANFGIGFFKVTREQTRAFDHNETEFGYSTGLGLGIALTQTLKLDVRGRLNIVPAEGTSSRKSAFVQGGLNYYFRL